MRAVKLRILAVTAVVGMLLAGCAHDTDEALRVGDVSVGNTQVDEIVAGILSRLGENPAKDQTADVRQTVVQWTAFTEVARRYAREQGVRVPAPDVDSAANDLGLDADDPLAEVWAEAQTHLTALLDDAEGRTPTEDEMRGVYDDFIAIAGADAATYEQIRDELLSLMQYHQALALRDALIEAADRYGVTVNPRYQPLEFPLLQVANGQLTLVSLPLGEQGTGAVTTAG
jgi:hypothetical protein